MNKTLAKPESPNQDYDMGNNLHEHVIKYI